MPIDRKTTRWNGWGLVEAHNPLEGRDGAWRWIAETLGVPELPHTPAKKLDEIKLRSSRLSPAASGALYALIGQPNVRDDDFERASHARGKSRSKKSQYKELKGQAREPVFCFGS